jgi:putative membrane protein
MGASLILGGCLVGGIALGTVSGLTPGIHANTFALLLAGLAPAIPAPARYVAVAMLAAGTIHTFLDVVPALALGVPDPAMAASALPGHRLVLSGQGREALRLSALGSGLAVAFALALAIPVTRLMRSVYPALRSQMPVVLLGVAGLLVVTESTWRTRAGACCSLAASGLLGVVALDLPAGGLVDAGGMLAPIFAGLFGVPVLLDALTGEGVPEQAEPTVTTSRRAVVGFALVGTLAGAGVGYLPGVSSAVAATMALLVVPEGGPRGFVVTTSGVNTANSMFALFALVALGTPRTGVLVAIDRTGVPLDVPLLVGSVVVAAGVGFVLVVTLGDRYLRWVGSLDYTRLSLSVLCLLVAVVAILTGPLGVGVLGLASVVGRVPIALGGRRANLMGVLLVPLALEM